jgi:hypothetical protein
MGFFDLIPLVGATLGSIVAALATTTVSFPIATIIWIVAIFLWQRFENYAIQPLIYGRVLHVNPIVTILAVLAGASLLGLLGALIAIPTAAAIQIVLSDWWSNRRARAEIAEDGATTARSAGGRLTRFGDRALTTRHAPSLAHTLRRAAAGASRAARTAGYRPASAPMTSASATPPATASTGTTTIQPWLAA